MANGQPKPAFYVAVLLVVVGLVGLALWRYGSIGPGGGQAGRISDEELKQAKGGAEAPDSTGITTVKEYKYVAAARLPEVKGISSYKPMADRTVRFAINVWAGWSPIIYANNGFKAGKVWKTPGGKDFKVELVLIDDPIAMRDAYDRKRPARCCVTPITQASRSRGSCWWAPARSATQRGSGSP